MNGNRRPPPRLDKAWTPVKRWLQFDGELMALAAGRDSVVETAPQLELVDVARRAQLNVSSVTKTLIAAVP